MKFHNILIGRKKKHQFEKSKMIFFTKSIKNCLTKWHAENQNQGRQFK